MKNMIAIVAATAAVLSMVVAGPMPASAHYTYLYHGKDIATVSEYHWVGTVCDQEKDGNRVVAYYRLTNGNTFGVVDNNGSRDGCGTREFIAPAVAFQICEETRCSAWRNT